MLVEIQSGTGVVWEAPFVDRPNCVAGCRERIAPSAIPRENLSRRSRLAVDGVVRGYLSILPAPELVGPSEDNSLGFGSKDYGHRSSRMGHAYEFDTYYMLFPGVEKEVLVDGHIASQVVLACKVSEGENISQPDGDARAGRSVEGSGVANTSLQSSIYRCSPNVPGTPSVAEMTTCGV